MKQDTLEGKAKTKNGVKRLCFSIVCICLLYTSDAADEEDSVDLGGRRIIKKKEKDEGREGQCRYEK